jgi:hypothetical protein
MIPRFHEVIIFHQVADIKTAVSTETAGTQDGMPVALVNPYMRFPEHAPTRNPGTHG